MLALRTCSIGAALAVGGTGGEYGGSGLELLAPGKPVGTGISRPGGRSNALDMKYQCQELTQYQLRREARC